MTGNTLTDQDIQAIKDMYAARMARKDQQIDLDIATGLMYRALKTIEKLESKSEQRREALLRLEYCTHYEPSTRTNCDHCQACQYIQGHAEDCWWVNAMKED